MDSLSSSKNLKYLGLRIFNNYNYQILNSFYTIWERLKLCFVTDTNLISYQVWLI